MEIWKIENFGSSLFSSISFGCICFGMVNSLGNEFLQASKQYFGPKQLNTFLMKKNRS
jgi:hypothetical protein